MVLTPRRHSLAVSSHGPSSPFDSHQRETCSLSLCLAALWLKGVAAADPACLSAGTAEPGDSQGTVTSDGFNSLGATEAIMLVSILVLRGVSWVGRKGGEHTKRGFSPALTWL